MQVFRWIWLNASAPSMGRDGNGHGTGTWWQPSRGATSWRKGWVWEAPRTSCYSCGVTRSAAAWEGWSKASSTALSPSQLSAGASPCTHLLPTAKPGGLLLVSCTHTSFLISPLNRNKSNLHQQRKIDRSPPSTLPLSLHMRMMSCVSNVFFASNFNMFSDAFRTVVCTW